MNYDEYENKALAFYRTFNGRSARRDENVGRNDGKRGFPLPEATEYPFQYEVMAHARRSLQAFDLGLQKICENLKEDISALERNRDENYVRQRDDTIEEKKAKHDALDQRVGHQSARYMQLSDRLSTAKGNEKRIELEIQRPLRISIVWIYFPLLLMLALAEVPVNRLAFEFFFLETPAISLFVALVVGLIIMFCAHFSGLWLRQADHYSGKFSKIFHLLGIAFTLVVVGVVIYFIAALRQSYVNLLERDQTSDFSTLLQRDTSTLGTLADDALSVDLGTAGLMLLAINILILLVGMVASYMRHDPHPDYEKVTKERKKIQRRIQRIEEKFQKRVAELSNEYDRRVGYLDRQLDQTEEEIEKTRNKLHIIDARRSKILGMMSEVISLRLLAYQKGNRSVRSGEDIPACFIEPNSDIIGRELHEG